MSTDYDGQQYVGIDLHWRRSVIVRMTEEGRKLACVRIDNDPILLEREIALAALQGVCDLGHEDEAVPQAELPVSYRPLGSHLDHRILDFLRATRAELSVDEYGDVF